MRTYGRKIWQERRQKDPFYQANVITQGVYLVLSLVATPIGNLADISFRAIETLKNCDYILCEDTRHSAILLNHYHIQKPLRSYHKFNEISQLDSIINDLKDGKNICLISDAGTPTISDPGEKIVKTCIENTIPVTAIPGACAAVQALICSGLPTDRFQFCGFLPKKENELKQEILSTLDYNGTTIYYESPHRLMDTLEMFNQLQPERRLVVGRELTKKFEEMIRGNAHSLIEFWKNKDIKGEIILLISPKEKNECTWEKLTPEEHVEWLIDHYQISKKEAIKLAAEMRGVPKREIYNRFLEGKD